MTRGHPVVTLPYTGTLYDRSLVANGGDQIAVSANDNRTYLLVFNGAAHPIGVNPTGGAAVLGGAGTVTVQPGDRWPFAGWVPTGAIHVTGTNGDEICVIEG